MMKLYLTILTFLFLSVSINAQDVKKFTYNDSLSEANHHFRREYSLYDSYAATFNLKEQSKEFNEMMEKVSKDFQSGLSFSTGGLANLRSCEILCIEHGTGTVRKTINNHTKGILNVSEDSKRCVRACTLYIGEYYGYIAGREDAKKEAAKYANINCSGAINSDKRESKPKNYEMYIDKESGKTKQK